MAYPELSPKNYIQPPIKANSKTIFNRPSKRTQMSVSNLNLYEELGVDSTATLLEIKGAFKKLALKYHPDKQIGKSEKQIQESVSKFQAITKYYECLVDPAKRKRYDETGAFDDDLDRYEFDGEGGWKEYFETLVNRVTPEAIAEYEKIYRYSETERNDVYAAYMSTRGCLLTMIDHVPLSTLDDIERFKEICQIAIDAGELEPFKKFPKINQKDLKRKRDALTKEEKEAESSSKKKKGKENGDLSALVATMRENNKARSDALIDKLEKQAMEKEEKKGKKKGGKSAPPPPMLNDEEFEAFQKTLLDRKK